jgi:hypothetical protein
VSRNLILIASYPKSGNTWVRLFFENLLRKERAAVSINDISNGLYGFERRRFFDSHAAVAAADLLPVEIENLLPDLYAEWAQEAAGPVFIKVHDKARKTPSGRWLFPPEHVRAVLYLARQPFTVAVSYAHHRGISIDHAVDDLCDESHVIAAAEDHLPLPLAERPGSWNSNVASWLNQSCYPLTVARYEDLYANPLAEFARLATATGLAASAEALARAVDATSFDRLQAEELACGFRERPRSSPAFFRSGRPDSSTGMLNAQLHDRLALQCSPAMARLGYRADGTHVPFPVVNDEWY